MNAITTAAPLDGLKLEYGRQLEHWRMAAKRLGNFDEEGSPQAWQSLEHYLGVSLRQTLRDIVARVIRSANQLEGQLRLATTEADLERVRGAVLGLRNAYIRSETSVEFYTDALATRAVPRMAALLRACDHIATRSMAEALAPLGRQVPAALTFIDAGLGASILKFGLRLWDGSTENPVATIKVVRHNLFRPTSIIHEAGHQVAHSLGWTEEVASALRVVAPAASSVGSIWASWASEIVADGFAFVHTGYGSVATLHDVVDGPNAAVFQYLPGDPHPIAFLRLLLGVEMCRLSYGAGPWDELAQTWRTNHPLSSAPRDLRGFLEESLPILPRVAEITLRRPYRAFGGQPLTAVINPQRVSPAALVRLEEAAGAAAFTSPYWMWNESIRLLALTSYRAAAGASALRDAAAQQEGWMLKLGTLRQAA